MLWIDAATVITVMTHKLAPKIVCIVNFKGEPVCFYWSSFGVPEYSIAAGKFSLPIPTPRSGIWLEKLVEVVRGIHLPSILHIKGDNLGFLPLEELGEVVAEFFEVLADVDLDVGLLDPSAVAEGAGG